MLFSIGAAFRARGSRVLYFAGYKLVQDRYKVDEIEHAADCVVWCCDEAPDRPQDRAFVGNIVEAIEAYGRGALGPSRSPLGGRPHHRDRLGRHDGRCRRSPPGGIERSPPAIASINSPTQCMMKEICTKCLQRRRDPVTGTETVVFS